MAQSRRPSQTAHQRRRVQRVHWSPLYCKFPVNARTGYTAYAWGQLNLHIRGECSAGDTLHTALNPTSPARPRTVVRFMNAGPVNLPSASAVPIPPVVSPTERTDSCHGVSAVTGATSCALGCRWSACSSGDVSANAMKAALAHRRDDAGNRGGRRRCRRCGPEDLFVVRDDGPTDDFVL